MLALLVSRIKPLLMLAVYLYSVGIDMTNERQSLLKMRKS